VRPKADDPDDPNKLVYLVSNQNSLYSFSPKIPGKAAYRLVGKLDCKAFGTPQSMAVDRNGFAWVFYDSGQLFKVSIIDASCQSTNYKHPTPNGLLGMGFTAVASGSAAERLYIISPDFGLANITMPDLSVVKLRTMHTTSELTGGGDGKLFQFESLVRRLSEFDTSTFSSHPIHTFSTMSNISAFAFARYAGKFYMFTSRELEWSQTTEYDPKTNTESVRDAAMLSLKTGLRVRAIDQRDHRNSELGCQTHQPQRFPITFRKCFAVVRCGLLLGSPAAFLAQNNNCVAIDFREATHDGRIVAAPAVSVQFQKTRCHVGDVIFRCGAACVPCQIHLLPRGNMPRFRGRWQLLGSRLHRFVV